MSGLGHAAVGPPSGLAQIIQCPGSVAMCAGIPDPPESEEIREGNAAEWVAQEWDAGRRPVIGHAAPNGVTITDEMMRGAMQWVYATRGATPAFVQTPVSCAPIHPSSWGTPDKARVDTSPAVIVYDYKFGHLLHDPFEHWQCIAYVTGLCHMFGLLGNPDVQCEIVIVQPRDYSDPIKSWSFTVGELRAYINIAHAAVAESQQPNAPLRVGPACLNCKAALKCRAFQYAASKVIEFSGRQSPVEMTTDALGAELTLLRDAIDLLKARHDAIEQQTLAMWFAGRKVRGYSCEQGVSRLNWNRDAGEVIATCDAYQIDVRKSKHPATITPTQAMQRGLPEEICKLIASRTPGEWKVVRDDPRKIAKQFEVKK